MVLVADVAGTTKANDAYWAEACKKIPSTAIGITVDMSLVRPEPYVELRCDANARHPFSTLHQCTPVPFSRYSTFFLICLQMQYCTRVSSRSATSFVQLMVQAFARCFRRTTSISGLQMA